MRALVAACFWFLAIAGSPALAKGPFNEFKIGNWDAGAFTNDETGDFSHCAASVSYQSGIIFVVSISVNFNWNIGFLKSTWHLQTGQTFPIDLTFDGNTTQRVYGVVKGPTFAIVAMPENSELINAFRAARVMTAKAYGNLFAFNLTGTSRLLPQLAECAKNKGRPSVAGAPGPQAPDRTTVQPVNREIEENRRRLLSTAGDDYDRCLQSQMKDLVPFSNENADTLGQVIITKCSEFEEKYVTLASAIYGASKEEVKKLVQDAIETKQKNLVADIVTFRAALVKSMTDQNKPQVDQSTKKSPSPNGI